MGALVVALLVLSCATRAHAIDITAAHINPPGEPTFEAFERMKSALDVSGIRLRVFPRGQLGDEKDMIEQVRLGAIGIASVSAAALSSFAPSVGVLDIPFLLRDQDHHPWVVADGPIGRRLAQQIEKESGLVVLDWWSAGMRHVFTRAMPVRSVEDLNGLKIRVIGSSVYIDTFNAMGAKSTPMPYGEVYTALATGTVDGAENDTTGYRNMKFYEQAPNLSLTGHFFLFKVVVASPRFLARLSPAQREALMQAMREATVYQRELSVTNYRADLEWFATQPRIAVTMPDRAALEAAVRPVQERYAQRFGRDLVEAIRGAR
jgi:tripartite ATP-independent transporter DctP family solute receptor